MNELIAQLREHLAVPVDSELIAKTTFVVPHTWPEIRNAEYEVLQRVALAARNIGCTMIVIDNDGYPLWSNRDVPLDKSVRVDANNIDFMISFHFESPRLIDAFSYYAVWQPLDFYFHFGYAKSVEKYLTHNDCLSCHSNTADAHAKNLLRSIRHDYTGLYGPNRAHRVQNYPGTWSAGRKASARRCRAGRRASVMATDVEDLALHHPPSQPSPARGEGVEGHGEHFKES